VLISCTHWAIPCQEHSLIPSPCHNHIASWLQQGCCTWLQEAAATRSGMPSRHLPDNECHVTHLSSSEDALDATLHAVEELNEKKTSCNIPCTRRAQYIGLAAQFNSCHLTTCSKGARRRLKLVCHSPNAERSVSNCQMRRHHVHMLAGG
jgi:hypothetical protein